MVFEFSTSHLSRGNAIFPIKVIINDSRGTLIIQKRRLIGYDQTTLKISNIISVSIRRFNEKIFLSEIVITTAYNEFRLNGFTPNDAQELKKLIEFLL